MDCIFCKILNKEIPAEFVYEDNDIAAFKDINPNPPVHLLIVSREHIPTVNDLEEKHIHLLGKMILTAKKLAKEFEIDEKGYRLVFNCNKEGGQEVFHIHMHLIGGRQLTSIG